MQDSDLSNQRAANLVFIFDGLAATPENEHNVAEQLRKRRT